MRLTRTFRHGEVHTLRTCCAKYYKKLSQLEDIEEELGIDLITLFKALKNEIFIKCERDNNIYCERIKLITYDEDNKKWYIDCYYGLVGIEVKDYGKTWALTKEELE